MPSGEEHERDAGRTVHYVLLKEGFIVKVSLWMGISKNRSRFSISQFSFEFWEPSPYFVSWSPSFNNRLKLVCIYNKNHYLPHPIHASTHWIIAYCQIFFIFLIFHELLTIHMGCHLFQCHHPSTASTMINCNFTPFVLNKDVVWHNDHRCNKCNVLYLTTTQR